MGYTVTYPIPDEGGATCRIGHDLDLESGVEDAVLRLPNLIFVNSRAGIDLAQQSSL